MDLFISDVSFLPHITYTSIKRTGAYYERIDKIVVYIIV